MDFGYVPPRQKELPQLCLARRCTSFDSDHSDTSDDKADCNYDQHDDSECADTIEMDENELKKMTNAQLRERLKALGLKVSGKKEELVNRLLNPNLHKKPESWKKSKAKALLTKLLQNRESRLHEMTPRQIYESNEWFQEYPFDRFKENVTSLRKRIQDGFAIIDRDIEIV